MPDIIDVATGIIIRGGRVLLTQRGPNQDYPFMWESPGGKVEPKETLYDALRRELFEEIGVEVTSGNYITTIEIDLGGPLGKRRLAGVHLFDVDIGDQTPLPLASVGIGWFGVEDVSRMLLLPANAAYRDRLTLRLAKAVLGG